MRMKVNQGGGLQRLFKARNKVVCGVRQQEVCHILYADIVRTESFAFLCKVYEIFVRVYGACRVRNRDFADSAVFLDCLYRRFKVSHVVQRVENSYYVYAVFNRIFDEFLNDVVGIMLIPEKVLTS